MATHPTNLNGLGDDLELTSIRTRKNAPGTWVHGTFAGHRFEALVFPRHAENPDFEIGNSRISKLWIKRLADGLTVYSWDRGMEIPINGDYTARIVDYLCARLADAAYDK